MRPTSMLVPQPNPLPDSVPAADLAEDFSPFFAVCCFWAGEEDWPLIWNSWAQTGSASERTSDANARGKVFRSVLMKGTREKQQLCRTEWKMPCELLRMYRRGAAARVSTSQSSLLRKQQQLRKTLGHEKESKQLLKK